MYDELNNALNGKTDWAKLHLNDDSHIDYSDIPATTKEFWTDADVFIPRDITKKEKN